MSYRATVFKVMIASPSDVEPERAIIREMLSEWNAVNSDRRQIVLLGVGWETHSAPEMGDRPQAIINKRVLRDCDLLVGVFWTRIGTATGNYPSGTVEEIEEHLKLGKPTMLYFSDAPVVPQSLDTGQYAALLKFKQSCKSRGLLETYSSLTDFKSKFYRQLQIKLNQDAYFVGGQLPASSAMAQPQQAAVLPLSREAQVLLLECADDPAGMIMRIQFDEGTVIQSSRKNFVEENNPRSVAIWEGALEELVSNGLLSSSGAKGEVFTLTRKGYELADLLRGRNTSL
jgi:hypothetical protein